MMMRVAVISLLAASAAACSTDPMNLDAGVVEDDASSMEDAAELDVGNLDASTDAGPTHLTTLPTAEALSGLQGPMGDVKYLAPVAGAVVRAPIVEPCYFQNMNLFSYHLLFLRSFPELANIGTTEYVDLVLRRPTRIWWGGGIKLFPRTPHPITGQGVIAYAIYHEAAGADQLNADDIAAVHAILAGCVDFSPELLAFLPTDPFQVTFARRERAALLTRGIAVIFSEELR